MRCSPSHMLTHNKQGYRKNAFVAAGKEGADGEEDKAL